MRAKKKDPPQQKSELHLRNKHRSRYDFPALIRSLPELSPYVSLNEFNDLSIDFADTEAVKMLNRALLKHFYGVRNWDIPAGYLCPPIPGRADYLHYAADLLAADNRGVVPEGDQVNVLDIGVGANCIYPLLGTSAYGWRFTGSDLDPGAITAAKKTVRANNLEALIKICRQTSPTQIFHGIVAATETFDLTVCNPPFYSSQKEASATTERKWKKLGHEKPVSARNFGGKGNELWTEGGEVQFVRQMIAESSDYRHACLWFTTLISSKETLPSCYRTLSRYEVAEVKTISMSQGQKISRMLAWTFLQPVDRENWMDKKRR